MYDPDKENNVKKDKQAKEAIHPNDAEPDQKPESDAIRSGKEKARSLYQDPPNEQQAEREPEPPKK